MLHYALLFINATSTKRRITHMPQYHYVNINTNIITI